MIREPGTSNKAIRSAFWSGAAAYRQGKRETDNPYGDARTYNGMVTFARAFSRAWNEGFSRAEGEQ